MRKQRFIFTVAAFIATLVGCGDSNAPDLVQHDADTRSEAPVPTDEPALLSEEGESRLFELSESLMMRYEENGLTALSAQEQVFALVWELDVVVHMDGLSQFFFYASGEYVTETISALNTINATATAGLLNQANELFGPDGASADEGQRQNVILDLDEAETGRLRELDCVYYDQEENVLVLLYQYVLEHSESFDLP